MSEVPLYRGTSLLSKCTPLGPYRRPMPRVLEGWAFSYGRGSPVLLDRASEHEVKVGFFFSDLAHGRSTSLACTREHSGALPYADPSNQPALVSPPRAYQSHQSGRGGGCSSASGDYPLVQGYLAPKKLPPPPYDHLLQGARGGSFL